MSTLNLIEFVRAIRASGHRYGAVDKDGEAFSYKQGPKQLDGVEWYYLNCNNSYLGRYNLACSWKDTLIDVTKLKGVK